MSRYSIFAPKEVNVKSESIKLYSQELLWNDQPISGGGGGGVTQLGAVAGPTNTNAGRITGNTLILAPCDVDNPGVVASGDQYFPPGTKHFQANVTLPATESSGNIGVFSIGGTQVHDYSQYPSVKNFFAGQNAGNFTTSGSYNIGIGTDALSSLTSGGSNLWLGHGTSSITSGQFNTVTTGAPNLTTGSYNVVLNGGHNLTTGSDNTFLGNGSGDAIDTGSGNIHIGRNAGDFATSGASNTIFIGCDGTEGSGVIQLGQNSTHQTLFLGGIQSLDSWPDNTHKVMIDYPSGDANIVYDITLENFRHTLVTETTSNPFGTNNTLLGDNTGTSLSSGARNTFYGANVGGSLSTGNRNLLLGYNTGSNYTEGDETDNVLLANAGITGDFGMIRIGDNNVHNNIFLGAVEGVSSLPDDGRSLILAGRTEFGVNGTKVQGIGPADFMTQYGFSPYHTDHSILLNSRSVSTGSFSGTDNVILRTGTQPIPITTGSNNIVIGPNAGYSMGPTANYQIYIGADNVDPADPDGTIRIGFNDTGHYNALYLAGVQAEAFPLGGMANKTIMWQDYSSGEGQVKCCTLGELKAALASIP